MITSPGIASEPGDGLSIQFWSQRQIFLGARQAGMSQVSGELDQSRLHISTFAIPSFHTMNGGRMAQIV